MQPRRTLLLAGLTALTAVVTFGLLAVSAYAQVTIDTGIGSTFGIGGSTDLRQTIVNIVQYVLGLLGLIAVIIILYGGFLWMTARGDAKRIDRAKRVLRNAVIGLVIILLAWATVYFVVRAVLNTTGSGNTNGTPPGCTGPGCVIGSDRFTLTRVETSHGGSVPWEDVLTCSKVQSVFNHTLDPDLTAALAAAPPLEVAKVAGGAVAGTFTAASNALVFAHPDLFDVNTDYVLRVPVSVRDAAGSALLDCTDPNCTFNSGSGNYEWRFRVGTGTDTSAPTVTTAYPQRTGTPGYPDRNVSRQPVLSVSFSESIDITTVMDSSGNPIPANVFVEEISGPGASGGTALPANQWTVRARTNGFDLSLVSPNALKAFTWYRINVINVEDLCSNPMAAGTAWEFQTNNQVAGIATRYPTGANQCPSTDISFGFGTTMWDHRIRVDITGPGIAFWGERPPNGENASISSFGGRFEILDPNPVPNNHYRVFRFTPFASLPTNASFTVRVTVPTLATDGSGGTFSDTWTFQTTSADRCACKPTVLAFSPDQGPRGQCLSVIGSCFTGTADHPADPAQLDLDFSKDAFATPVAATVGGVAANAVTTTLPQPFVNNDRVKARVAITYTDAAFGTVTSDPSADEFLVNADELATGPCLYSLQPNAGLTGSGVSAIGTRFGAPTAQSRLTFAGGSDAPYISWVDTRINATVPGTATTGLVHVSNAAGTSNGVPYTVQLPVPGTPVVTASWPNCDTACVNAAAGATFNLRMDPATLNYGTGVVLRPCADANCDAAGLGAAIGASATYTYNANPATSRLDITPASNLAVDRWYRAVLTGARADPSVGGAALGGLNYASSGSGAPDAYAWTFKTKNDPALCALASVGVTPATRTLTDIPQSVVLTASAVGSPDSCSASGQVLNPNAYTWSWTTADSAYVSVGSDTDNTTVATSVAETVPPGPGPIAVRATAAGRTGQSLITVDKAWCDESTDCTKAGLCTSSSCNNALRRCTPVVTAVAPNAGTAGNYVSVNGCYFGGYSATTSKVTFTSGRDAAFPDPTLCGAPSALWTDSKVTVEVPTGVTAGGNPVRVTRSDGTVSVPNSPADHFTENGQRLPGLCRISPTSGTEGSTVTLYGKNFGAAQGGGDGVRFTSNVASTLYSSWTDTQVQCTVPTGAATGDVVLFQGTTVSNGLPYTVRPASCQACTANLPGQCATGSACGTDGCCALRPSVALSGSDVAPTGTDICRNAVVTAGFDPAVPLHPSSVNAENVVVLRTKTTSGAGPSAFTGAANLPTVPGGPNVYGTASAVNFGTGGTALLTLTTRNAGPDAAAAAQQDARFAVEVFADRGTVGQLDGADTRLGAFANPAVGDAYTGYLPVSAPAGTYRILLRWNPTAAQTASGTVFERVELVAYPTGRIEPGTITLDDTTNRIRFTPGQALERNVPYLVRLRGAQVRYGIRSLAGATLLDGGSDGSATDRVWSFTTQDRADLCVPTSVELYNNLLVLGGGLVNLRPPATTSSAGILGLVRDIRGTQIAPVPGVLDWSWGWSATPNPRVAVTNSNSANQTVSFDTAGGLGTGTVSATATAGVGWTGSLTGTAEFTLTSCSNFRAIQDSNPEFYSYYCRDGGLPDFSYTVSGTGSRTCNGTEPNQAGCEVKEYFYKESATAHDAIGLKVFPNTVLKLSPGAWFTKQFGTGRSPSPTTVNGFPAALDGNTYYITAPNLVSGSLYDNLYVLSYNQDASDSTRQVFAEIVKNLRFANSLGSTGLVTLRQDFQRAQDLSDISQRLLAKGKPYPDLAAGSYLPGFSTSAWPSWQETLGTALGATLPRDLSQGFPRCPVTSGYEAATCWKQATREFKCQPGLNGPSDQVYAYKRLASGGVELYARLNYSGSGTWQQSVPDACSGLGGSGTTCTCFNYRVTLTP